MAGASILLASLTPLSPTGSCRRVPCESQIATVESLRALNYAQMEYEQTHPESGYAPTLSRTSRRDVDRRDPRDRDRA